ncbi:MAG: hypothetical protein JXQ91_07475 [Vannielia sp.]|uniref:hypothetical protein n=1 Tax=Vannielia sp. TaxID=2813045 RepID=UPI003B8BC663
MNRRGFLTGLLASTALSGVSSLPGVKVTLAEFSTDTIARGLLDYFVQSSDILAALPMKTVTTSTYRYKPSDKLRSLEATEVWG